MLPLPSRETVQRAVLLEESVDGLPTHLVQVQRGEVLAHFKSAVHEHIQQALALCRATAGKMAAQILEQERAKLQAIVDRWLPVAIGPGRAKEAARAAEIVRRTSDRLRVLYGLPVPPELPPPAPVASAQPPSADPAPKVRDPELELLMAAADDVVFRMARAGLLPSNSYDGAWDALEAWQPGKYQPPSGEVEGYLRSRWGPLLESLR